MYKILSPTLSLEQIKRKKILNESLKLNNDYLQKKSNDNFLPSFDFGTDIKFLTNSNAAYFYQINSNPYELSKLSLDKYKNMNAKNFELSPEKLSSDKIRKNNKNINNNIDDNKKENSTDKVVNYKKINTKKNSKPINDNNLREFKKKEDEIKIENSNDNLKVSSILNETIGDNFYNGNNQKIQNVQNNDELINYLKKENNDLKKLNQKNTQLLNYLFYFINELSQNYTHDKKNFDISYYSSNLNSLPSDLNNLNQIIKNRDKTIENSSNLNETISNKNEEKNKNNDFKKSNKEKEKNRRKNIDNADLGRTFTFGQNDSFSNKITKGNSTKNKNDKKNIINNKINIKKINNNKNKNKTDINVLGCKIKGNNTIKNNSKQ